MKRSFSLHAGQTKCSYVYIEKEVFALQLTYLHPCHVLLQDGFRLVSNDRQAVPSTLRLRAETSLIKKETVFRDTWDIAINTTFNCLSVVILEGPLLLGRSLLSGFDRKVKN